MKSKGIIKRISALIMVAVITISALPITRVTAATGDVKTITFTPTYDEDGVLLKYNSGALVNGHYAGGEGDNINRISVDGDTAYCIQPGVTLNSGDKLKESSSDAWKALSDSKKKAVGLALLYGYQGNKKNLDGSDDEKWAATQALVWEFVAGCRNTSGKYKRTEKTVYSLYIGSNYSNAGIEKAYDQIVDLLKEHNTIPSFMSEEKEEVLKDMKFKNGKYTVTLTDENKVLADYKVTCSNDKINISTSGNKLTISSTEAFEDSIRIKAVKNSVPTVNESAKLIAYGADDIQDVITGVENADKVTAYVNVQTKNGNLAIKKISEDGIVSGISFTVKGEDIEKTVKTANDGTITIEGLVPGEYTVTEATYDRYAKQESKTVTVVGGKTATVTFSNVLKKFNVTVKKEDAEFVTSQGNANLAGAVYGIYKGGKLVDKYTTDEKGQFTTGYYVCGSDWTLKEIASSEGYQLDDTVYTIGAEEKLYEVQYNKIEMKVYEDVDKGNIAIIKHTDNGETKIETPEVGATFEVYLKSAGSYNTAKETEKDILVCDENGYAKSKDMPYGVYTVHQTSGWEGRELIDDFDVFISENEETYRYLINNKDFESYVKIVKKDAETGKIIPCTGAGFQIYDPDGNLVTMKVTYPKTETIDTFYTTDEGMLITPQSLPSGKGYSIVEVQAQYQYILDSEPVFFDVTEYDAKKEDSITVIEVVKYNTPQKGKITVTKSGEIFHSVLECDGLYQPVYKIEGLKDAVYEIIATEDIVTPDGTVRAKKGEVVDTITTGDDGTATSKELYLGKYEIKESTAPYGMVLNKELHLVELAYARQEVKITETSTSFINERQKIKISLSKYLEINDAYGIGVNDEMSDVKFGLYAMQDLVAEDSSIIPKDGLIEVITFKKDGIATAKSDLPFGSYYVKEIETNAAYLISDEIYPVTFEYEGQETDVVEILINNGNALKNEIIYGTVRGIKLDEDGNGLGGAVIGIFKMVTKEFTKENAIATVTSADDGSFSFEKVPYGTWVVKEIESPTGFILSEKEITVTIGAVGEVIEIKLINNYIRGNVEVVKIDEDNTKKKLSGAVFVVYEDTNGNGKFDKHDKRVGRMKETDKGVYRMEGLKYGGYFVYEKKSPKKYKKDDGYYYFTITLNGETIRVENKKGVGFTNEKEPKIKVPQTGDNSMTGFFIGIGAIALGGLVSLLIVMKKKKEDEE